MIEVSAKHELRDTIKVGTPNENGSNTTDVVTIEYECNHHDVGKGRQTLVYRPKQKVSVEKHNENTGPPRTDPSSSVKIESHVSISKLSGICNFIFSSWNWSSSNSVCQSGTRIIVGWDPGVVQLMFIAMTDQVIHCVVEVINGNWESFVSFVYADNYYIQRRQLRNSILMHNSYVGTNPWVVLGYFNVALDIEESTASSSSCTLAMLEFRECLDNLNMSDVNHGGFQYTWNQRPNAATVVEDGWKANIHGHSMYRVVKKLRELKRPVRKLMWSKGNLHDRVIQCRGVLEAAQKALDDTLFCDNNTSYFHKVVKGRMNRNRIVSLQDDYGNMIQGDDVPRLFLQHFTNFLGNATVKKAIFVIGDRKSPGPDGYSAVFFKESWDIIGDEEINSTIITLLPKVHVPNKVNDFRPISCCNVIYKCISKIISDRIKGSLDDIVSTNQLDFIPGHRIADNILLTQEIMKNYYLDRGVSRCAFKVDIQKAYDIVDWKFLQFILTWFGYPRKMIKWIMSCITTTSYTISVNGELHGFFKGKRGL
ncbi:uncharacterized protein [Rutidosis leptorrhynchoides]|uniref:uncharacterized protein n=1 Tax=Rutidosis leptorrhynchoides TaxID=125765 RepID=UPI003A98ECA4